ncbi:unnamed protein product [Amaranthus hypochondriacus]
MEETKKYITSEELKKHNKAGDLWISIQGKVYDVTNWAKEHPGGDIPLLALGGKDVTDAFIAYHPGTTWNMLNKFFNGYYLKDFEVSEMSKDYRKLHNELSKMGLFDRKGHIVIYAFISIFILFTLSVYGVICSDNVFVHLGCGALLGMAWIQSAYLGHDSGHYQIMSSPGYNKVAQILTGNCLTGISMAWWKWTHNTHHITCNSLDYDPDLQHIPVFAVSSEFFYNLRSCFYGRKMDFDPIARFLVSYQHYTYYPVMVVARFNLYLQTILLLFNPNRNVPNRVLNIIGILVFWTWYPLLISCLPTWEERVFFVLSSFVVTAFQHIQFTLNHFSANVYVGQPEGNDWFEKQANGSIDIDCPSFMDWLFGGLQFQLEHHLFPRLPRCNLRSIAPVVKDLCKKHNLPYRSLSFWEANVSTINTLREAALQARDLPNPLAKNLLWEAVNTYG